MKKQTKRWLQRKISEKQKETKKKQLKEKQTKKKQTHESNQMLKMKISMKEELDVKADDAVNGQWTVPYLAVGKCGPLQ